jgi:hypothetical protein
MVFTLACYVAVLVTWMIFASGIRELRRGTLIMLETHTMMSSLIFCLFLILEFRLALTLELRLALHLVLCLVSLMDLTIAHMVFGSRENIFVPRRFDYGPRLHRGDRSLRRPGFPAGGFHTRFEPRHLDDSRFPRRGSHPTRSNGDVQKIVKTSSGHMVKCWISKIYLTNPNIEASTFSCHM